MLVLRKIHAVFVYSVKQALDSFIDVRETSVRDLCVVRLDCTATQTRCEQAAPLLQHVLYCGQREAGAKQPLAGALGVIY